MGLGTIVKLEMLPTLELLFKYHLNFGVFYGIYR